MLGDRARGVLDILDDMSWLPGPSWFGRRSAVHTEHFHELSLLRKILLRMRSWQNYVFFESLQKTVGFFRASVSVVLLSVRESASGPTETYPQLLAAEQ